MDFLSEPSAKEAERGTGAARSKAGEAWEKDEEKIPGAAVTGGRSGECIEVVADDLSDSGPGTEARAENDADRGDGRLGDAANIPGLRPRKPAEGEPAIAPEGGP
jgi:hypothetical protein